MDTSSSEPEGQAAPQQGEAYEVVWTPAPAIDAEAELPARYELARDLGDGLGGPAFGVRDRESEGRMVRLDLLRARATLDTALAAELEELLRAARRVVSAHVARVREVGRLPDGRVYVVSDLVEGESLAQRLAREHSLHPLHALEIVRQVLLGLESAHAAGVAHLALGPSSIQLAVGAPKSDADPHGTAVRISDLGIGLCAQLPGGAQPPLAAPEQREGRGDARSDLFAVGALLALLVGAELDHPLTPAIEALVARATAADPAARYPDAGAMRAAVESVQRSAERGPAIQAAAPASTPAPVPAPRPAAAPASAARGAGEAGERPKWVTTALAALGIVVLVEGGLLWRSCNEVEASENRMVSQSQTAAELAHELDSVREQAAAAERAKTELGEQLARAEQSSAEAVSAQRALAEEARAELERERAERERTEQALRTSEARAEQFARQVAQLEIDATDASRAARAFDAALEHVVERRGADAARRVRAIASDGLSVPSFADELATAAEALQRFDAGRARGRLDPSALRTAGEAIERAELARPALASEAGAWFDHGGAAARRSARSAEALRGMRAELERAQGVVAEFDLSEWSAIAAGPGMQDPGAAFAHAELYGCAHLDELAPRFASELRAWALLDGSLDVPRLQTFHHLRDWLERARDGRVKLAPSDRAELELAEFAQRWYDLDSDNDAAPDWGSVAFPEVIAASKEWRHELQLAWKLGQPGSGYPIREGGLLVFRSVDDAGQVEWWRETPLAVGGDSWRVRRERLAADGSTAVGEGVIRIDRKGGEFGVPGSSLPVCDLRAHGAALLVAPYPPRYSGELPAALALPELGLEHFRSLDGPCLVFVQGDVRRWFNPRWGLVREETRTPRGWIARELVYAR